nr:PREDICTED: cationic amino acid transporter 4-like [Linepithema humile]
MPAVRRMILGDIISIISDLWYKINHRKKLDDIPQTPLERYLSTFDITLLGVGHMVGGIYLVTGVVAHTISGPGVILSLLLAGFVSVLAALCYVELAVRVPKDSVYVFTYNFINEFINEYPVFFVGWFLILKNVIGIASMARVWSGYVDSLVNGAISNYTHNKLGGWLVDVPDFLAGGTYLIYTLLLGVGVKTSVTINSLLTIINLIVMGLIVVLGIYYADISNWSSQDRGFMPFKFSDVIKGAATCLYAFIGFDSIATFGQEARDPQRSIPRATLLSVIIVIIGYISISTALTLIVPFWAINPTAAFPEAFLSKGISWAKYVISRGALCGMTSLFGSLFSLPRTLQSTNAGLLFSFGRINERTQVSVCNVIINGFGALIALLFNLHQLVEFMSLGSLLTYTMMAFDVILLRYDVISAKSISNRFRYFSKTERRRRRLRYTIGRPNNRSSSSTEKADVNNYNSVASARSELRCEGIGKVRQRYAWMKDCFKLYTYSASKYVIFLSLLIYTTACLFISVLLILALKTSYGYIFAEHFFMWMYFTIIVVSISIIAVHKQNPPDGKFRVPLVPLIPALSILFNIILMMHLTNFSLEMGKLFFIWMAIGTVIYFLCGIHCRKEASNNISNSNSILMITLKD